MKLEWINEIETRLGVLESIPVTPIAPVNLEPVLPLEPFDSSLLEARLGALENSGELTRVRAQLTSLETLFKARLEKLEGVEASDEIGNKLLSLEQILEDIKLNFAKYIPDSRPFNDTSILARLKKLEGGSNGSD